MLTKWVQNHIELCFTGSECCLKTLVGCNFNALGVVVDILDIVLLIDGLLELLAYFDHQVVKFIDLDDLDVAIQFQFDGAACLHIRVS